MEILVYADWRELNGPTLMGTLSVAHIREREILSFSYSKDWLEKGTVQMLDPERIAECNVDSSFAALLFGVVMLVALA